MKQQTRENRLILAAVAFVLALALVFSIVRDADAANIPQSSTAPQVIVADCPDYEPGYACADSTTIWVPRGSGPEVFWHEYEHVLDLTDQIPEWLRLEFGRLTHDRGDWWGDVAPGESGYDPPGEKFADAFAECALNATGRGVGNVTGWSRTGKPRGVETYYGYEAPWRVHSRICRLTWAVFGLRWSAHLKAPCAPCSVVLSWAARA